MEDTNKNRDQESARTDPGATSESNAADASSATSQSRPFKRRRPPRSNPPLPHERSAATAGQPAPAPLALQPEQNRSAESANGISAEREETPHRKPEAAEAGSNATEVAPKRSGRRRGGRGRNRSARTAQDEQQEQKQETSETPAAAADERPHAAA